jgi:hypothetical protein
MFAGWRLQVTEIVAELVAFIANTDPVYLFRVRLTSLFEALVCSSFAFGWGKKKPPSLDGG